MASMPTKDSVSRRKRTRLRTKARYGMRRWPWRAWQGHFFHGVGSWSLGRLQRGKTWRDNFSTFTQSGKDFILCFYIIFTPCSSPLLLSLCPFPLPLKLMTPYLTVVTQHLCVCVCALCICVCVSTSIKCYPYIHMRRSCSFFKTWDFFP